MNKKADYVLVLSYDEQGNAYQIKGMCKKRDLKSMFEELKEIKKERIEK